MTISVDTKNVGRITQIIGPVLDVAFPAGKMPNIYNAIVRFVQWNKIIISSLNLINLL